MKGEFYRIFGSGFKSACIATERNAVEHDRMRKALSGAFSMRALIEQEDIVRGNIDAFIKRIGVDGGPDSKGLDMTKWFEMVSFDILGDMAFGENFGSIARGE